MINMEREMRALRAEALAARGERAEGGERYQLYDGTTPQHSPERDEQERRSHEARTLFKTPARVQATGQERNLTFDNKNTEEHAYKAETSVGFPHIFDFGDG